MYSVIYSVIYSLIYSLIYNVTMISIKFCTILGFHIIYIRAPASESGRVFGCQEKVEQRIEY